MGFRNYPFSHLQICSRLTVELLIKPVVANIAIVLLCLGTELCPQKCNFPFCLKKRMRGRGLMQCWSAKGWGVVHCDATSALQNRIQVWCKSLLSTLPVCVELECPKSDTSLPRPCPWRGTCCTIVAASKWQVFFKVRYHVIGPHPFWDSWWISFCEVVPPTPPPPTLTHTLQDHRSTPLQTAFPFPSLVISWQFTLHPGCSEQTWSYLDLS